MPVPPLCCDFCLVQVTDTRSGQAGNSSYTAFLLLREMAISAFERAPMYNCLFRPVSYRAAYDSLDLFGLWCHIYRAKKPAAKSCIPPLNRKRASSRPSKQPSPFLNKRSFFPSPFATSFPVCGLAKTNDEY